MGEGASHEPPGAGGETPGDLLDALRARPDWSDRGRDAVLDRIVTRFPADEVVAAVLVRLGDLGGPDAEVLLRLVEANPRPPLLRALGEALIAQPGLPPERAWVALAVLHGAGALSQFPALVDRWDELHEALDEDASVEQLIEQIDGDPEGVWLALQGLGAVEPEVRVEIIAGLAPREGPLGPGLAEFFRLLAYAHDPATRGAALAALEPDPGFDDPARAGAWLDLDLHHPLPEVAEAARLRIARAGLVHATAASAPTRVERSLVTAVDRRGRATIVLDGVRGSGHATAVFGCDVTTGVYEVFGEVSASPALAGATFREFAGGLNAETIVEDDHELTLGLLAGCLTLCGPETPPALRFWLESTAGPDFRPRPFPAAFPGWDPAALTFEEMERRSRDVLEACPDWLDDGPLTYELAEELALREGASPVDPGRDVGAFRFLFEHRLRGRLEHYRRMLLWMAGLWRSEGQDDLARSALGLAWQLSDPQHAVPGHPFTVALTARSLTAARDALAQGFDPRKTRRR